MTEAGAITTTYQYDLRGDVFASLQRLDGAAQDALQTGQVVSRSITDVGLVQGLLAFVQEKGLEAAADHIKELEERVRQLEAGAGDHRQAEQGGFLSSIFGSTQTQQPAPAPGPWGGAPRDSYEQPQRGYDNSRQMPQQPTGPWSQQAYAPSAGGSFLRGALGTAAGVAGGMLLANSLSGIFGNHMSSLGWGSPFGANPFGNASAPTEETVINNYFGNDDTRQASDNAADDSNDDNLQQADYDDGDDYSDDSSGDAE